MPVALGNIVSREKPLSRGGARPGGRPSREESQRKIARLLESAREIFVAKSYAATSVAQIARAADVSKPTIYAHFGSKAELFRVMLESLLQGHLRGVETLSVEEDPEAGLTGQVGSILRASLEPEFLGLFRLFLAEGHKFPELVDAFEQTHSMSTRLLLPWIEKVAERRSLVAASAEVAGLLLALVNEIVMMQSIGGSGSEPVAVDREAGRIVNRVLHGVVRDPRAPEVTQ